MKRIAAISFTLLLLAGIANARGPGNPGGGPGGPGGPGGGPEGGHAIVAADGTIFVTRVVTDSATDTSTTQIVAVTPAGTTAWTATLTDRRGGLLLSGSNLLSVSDSSTDSAVSSTVTARSTATGAVSWTATLNGRITDLEPFSGGTYAIVVVPPATTDGTARRSLVAISDSGATLWTVSL
jgi:hypothetical protein